MTFFNFKKTYRLLDRNKKIAAKLVSIDEDLFKVLPEAESYTCMPNEYINFRDGPILLVHTIEPSFNRRIKDIIQTESSLFVLFYSRHDLYSK